MEIKEARAAIEAILFASGDPISVDRISETLALEKSTTVNLLQLLDDALEEEDRGIELVRVNDSYQLCVKSRYASYVRSILDMRRNLPLSQAALEVLAVIAYNQPVTNAFIEQVRGVDSSSVVNGLVEKGLIEEKGRLELPGRPLLYGTTESFLRCLNISSLTELPELPQKEEAQEEEALEEEA